MENVLVTQYYNSESNERQKELDRCLIENNNLNSIDRIYVFSNGNLPIDSKKIVKINTSERLKYSDFFSLIQKTFVEKNNYILSNSDIYFDSTIEKVRTFNLEKKIFALARYDEGVLFNRRDAQDVWVTQDFKFSKSLIEKSNFNLGVPGCDNRIAALFMEEGYEVRNPSLDIHVHHVHKSNFRTYTKKDKIPPPYHFVYPEKIFE